MISRCRYCGDIAPDGSTICDTCAFIESEDGILFDPGDYDESNSENDTMVD